MWLLKEGRQGYVGIVRRLFQDSVSETSQKLVDGWGTTVWLNSSWLHLGNAIQGLAQHEAETHRLPGSKGRLSLVTVIEEDPVRFWPMSSV